MLTIPTREQIASKRLLRQPAEQPWQAYRYKAVRSRWRKHSVSCETWWEPRTNAYPPHYRDYYLYDPNLPVALVGSVDPSRSPDYPTTISIGPSYFESYSTFPNAKYIHGFNLGKNGTAARTSLLATVPLACKALEDGKLAYWELGNEPDLYKTSAQGHVRPPTWTERDYVNEWLEGTRAIKKALAEVCPDLVTKEKYGYYAPSFAGTSNSLNPITTWKSGLDTDEDVRVVSSHK